jgi:hypothetical protein
MTNKKVCDDCNGYGDDSDCPVCNDRFADDDGPGRPDYAADTRRDVWAGDDDWADYDWADYETWLDDDDWDDCDDDDDW